MKTFLSFIDSVSDWSGKVFSLLWLLVVILIVLEVTLRYGFGAPTMWGHELVMFLCGAVYMVGGANALYHRRHVNVDVVYNYFSSRTRAILDLVTSSFFFLFIGILLWSGALRFWDAVVLMETSGSVWNPPVYPVLLMIPLGAFLMLLQGLAKFIRDLTMAISGKEAA